MRRWVDVLQLRLRSLFRRGAADHDLDRELRFHLDSRVKELIQQGMRADDARAAANREFGSVASIADQCRDTRRVSIVHNLVQDLRYGARVLRAQPMLLVAATTSIALGVGVNLTIFGLASDLLLSTPSSARSEELVHIRTAQGSHTSHPVWREFDAAGALAGIAGYDVESDVIWRGRDISVPLTPLLVTANFFDVVGVPVAMGRGFTATEAVAERDPRVAVLSDGFWRTRLGADPAVLGQALTLNGSPYTVIGILPRDVRSLPGYGMVPHLILPFSPSLVPGLDRPGGGHVQLIGRLWPTQSVDEGRAALATVAARVGATHNDPNMGTIREMSHVGGIGQLRELREIVAFFGVLLIVTILVLAIACANVAGLLIARGTTRRREIALRLAIGASRGRLIQQLLTEGFLLSVLGTAGGLLITAALGQFAAQLAPQLPVPVELHISLDTRVVWVACTLVILSTLFCGLTPALQATRPALSPALKQEAVTFVHRRFNMRGVLVTGQVAVAVLLLVMTALFLRNLALARGLSPGFETARTLVAQVTFVEGKQGTATEPAVAALLDRVRALPGVEAATFSGGIPLTMRFGGQTGTEMRIEGREQPVRVDYINNSVGPEYFRTMGLEMLRGRDFSTADRVGSPMAVVINDEFARRYFDGHDPVGRHIFIPTARDPIPALVIGVVSNSKYRSIGEEQSAAVYDAYLQRRGAARFVNIIVRTAVPPDIMSRSVRDAIMNVDTSAAVNVEPMTTAIAFAFLPSRIGAALVGALGALGAILAMVGLYGVVSFAVSRRTSEIGIRMALGASRGAVMRLVLRDGAIMVGVGVIAGLGIALLATMPLRAFLVAGLPTTDPVSFGGTAALLVLTSLAAAWGPARRATRVEPAVTLRAD